jgi:hypothetical protein
MGPFRDGWKESDVEVVLARGLPEELLFIPNVVGMNAASCDRLWAENICLRLADHKDPNVRGNAVLGLGHIARTCRALSSDKALSAIERALADPDPYVRGQADCAADDVRQYLGVVVARCPPLAGEDK